MLGFNVLLSLSVCLSTAPLTDKPPKILSPSESQMSVIEMTIGKEACFIPLIDGWFSVRQWNMQCHTCGMCLFVITASLWISISAAQSQVNVDDGKQLQRFSDCLKRADIWDASIPNLDCFCRCSSYFGKSVLMCSRFSWSLMLFAVSENTSSVFSNNFGVICVNSTSAATYSCHSSVAPSVSV